MTTPGDLAFLRQMAASRYPPTDATIASEMARILQHLESHEQADGGTTPP
jgi:hypothetical protein